MTRLTTKRGTGLAVGLVSGLVWGLAIGMITPAAMAQAAPIEANPSPENLENPINSDLLNPTETVPNLAIPDVDVIPNLNSAITRLFVSYPPANHVTTAEQIFIIGTGAPQTPIRINGNVVDRSPQGHFAPSIPLQLGENIVTVEQGDETLTLKITREASTITYNPEGFTLESLQPAVNLARSVGELVCFQAIAPAALTAAQVSIAGQTIILTPDLSRLALPDNLSVLTDRNQPIETNSDAFQSLSGCTQFEQPGYFGFPEFSGQLNGRVIQATGTGAVEILPRSPVSIATITSPQGVARTGPSTDHSRLSPLPAGTRATITGREGDWLRLDYGGWIRAEETMIASQAQPVHTVLRSANTQTVGNWLEFRFPLQVPVPVTVDQSDDRLTLTLFNTVTETDFIRWTEAPWLKSFDWQQVAPDQAEFRITYADQPWGYRLRYDGTTLVLSLRQPPPRNVAQPLAGVTIVLDPGHGGPEDFGTRGPTGLPEKELSLTVSRLLRDRLEARGARVVMTRDADVDLGLADRVATIESTEPTIALSLHYNALPDDGNAIDTAGVSAFWFHPQAESLARSLQRRMVTTLDRPSYGAFWANFALTRPSSTLAVLLELGFAINPNEFEWIADPTAQAALADTLAQGLEDWVRTHGTPAVF